MCRNRCNKVLFTLVYATVLDQINAIILYDIWEV